MNKAEVTWYSPVLEYMLLYSFIATHTRVRVYVFFTRVHDLCLHTLYIDKISKIEVLA
jgi:hypothetical protein